MICECGAIRDARAAEVVDGGGNALCATGADDVDADMKGRRIGRRDEEEAALKGEQGRSRVQSRVTVRVTYQLNYVATYSTVLCPQ